ncbi:hypothetical protein AALO_G00240350 [Alosa alosa]|uniref:AMP-dependent synthetase/ligase domain-containing protein n=1 Tax=Alosa alosa TaxID=278164 RepID=A0AAV6FVP6_9TELE|nr:hypothetical protein AALO_G00240350 [Alosa alosa]
MLGHGNRRSETVVSEYEACLQPPQQAGQQTGTLSRQGDRVALVFPNSDPAAFLVAFYGCLLAELVPVPVEVPLSKKDAGSQQIGFLLGSCGVTIALTTDTCHKGLPKSLSGEIQQLKGWPKLLWVVTDSKHLCKPPSDWYPHIKDANNDTAYVEYKTHTESCTITQSCGYTEAETIVNVLDFKKDVGLWHGVLTSVMNMMHVISVPYALMKVNPLSWIQKVCQYKETKATLPWHPRILLVADGANPWSVSSCDAFLNVFQTKGLRPEVICPCASSAEALTISIRRALWDSLGGHLSRGVISMAALSHGVIRNDSEQKLSTLTLQDVGSPLPGATGRLVCGMRLTMAFGLLGFVDEEGRVFITGQSDGLMCVSGKRHNADDIIATALAVEPMKFVYRGRIAVFSINVLHDERIVVIAEQRPEATEEESFQWMSRVLQAMDSLHQVGVYCLALVSPNSLPRSALGGLHLSETRSLFHQGALHPRSLLMSPHTCVTNLPKPRQKQPEVGPASVMVGNLVSGKRIAQASGRDLGSSEEND